MGAGVDGGFGAVDVSSWVTTVVLTTSEETATATDVDAEALEADDVVGSAVVGVVVEAAVVASVGGAVVPWQCFAAAGVQVPHSSLHCFATIA